MTTTKTCALAALAAASLTATACGSSEQGEATAAAGQPMAAEEKIVDLASGETVPTTPETAPIATVEGAVAGTKAELLRLHRSGRVVTVSLRLHAPETGPTFHPESAEGMRLVDEVNARQHFPLEDPEGNCLCTDSVEGLYNEETAGVYAKFPAPPEGVDAVSLHVPGFPSFDAVPLGQ